MICSRHGQSISKDQNLVKASSITCYSFSDADLEERTRIERQEIVARYDLGRDDGAKIDDWEDPKLEVYHKQDRWGFIQ